MFSFFKKKPAAPVAPPLENEEVASTPAPSPAQDTPSLSEPTLSAQDAVTASAEPAATETAPTQEPVTPEATAEAANAPKHSWTERLKAGLGIHSAATLPETPAIEPATTQAPALEAELTHAATEPHAPQQALTAEPDAIPAPESAPLHTPTIEVPAENAAPAADTQPIAASPAPSAPPLPEAPPAKKGSWTERLKAGLAKTRSKLGKSLAALFGGGKIDEDLYEELEAVLLTADMGIAATTHLLGDVRQRVSLKGLKDASELKGALKDSINELIEPLEKPLDISGKKPFVIMLAGVNGAGKTTSIGKLAK
ncbi:signal recognition particle receptor subunit alpha, partial [Craterilacuibacter sp.]|uniref:signal recognition particle receptor subunit alpha n=1 Tax=Craterilacuibacter sp. TaxID=2870909 RepID=UPI003F386624